MTIDKHVASSLLTLLLLSFLVSACAGADATFDDEDVGGDLAPAHTVDLKGRPLGDLDIPDVELTTRELETSTEDFLNPERGFYIGVDLLGGGDMSFVREQGHTLAIALVRLDAYRNRPLDDALLTKLDQGFAAAEAAGIKVVLRFMYNSSFSADAPKDMVLHHLQQLAPHLEANAHVIAVMQGGFIGAWGEWHGSTNGLTNPAAQAEILAGLLEALPTKRFVQIRTPMAKANALPGGPLTASEAFTGSARARVGHHNDCFLASDSDLGTYDAPISAWQDFVATETQYVPMGGETCGVYAPRSDCAPALEALANHHWSYVNKQYHQQVLANWDQQGCGPDISRRLGYRLAADRVTYAAKIDPGGSLPVMISLTNHGFAAPYHERPAYIVLTDGATRYVHRLSDVDPRRWAAGSSPEVGVMLELPSDMEPGIYSLELWLPDEDPGLTDDGRFAIRLANPGWDGATGSNVLVDEIVVGEP